jgi:PiT family inorganic phosphate transporter
VNPAEMALVVGFVLSFLMAIALGGNDAASPTANVVGARVLTIRQSIVLFAIFATVGALSQGYMNMKTIGTGIVPQINLLGAIVIVLSAFVWIMFCNTWGLEISVTHSIVGGVVGYGLAAFGMGDINWDLIQKVVLSWFISPVLAAVLAFTLHRLLTRMTQMYATLEKRLETVIKIALCYSAYAFGANDIANSTGVYVCVTNMVLGHPPQGRVMLLLAAFGSVGVVIGGLWLGPRVIETVAFKILRLSVVSGTAAEITNALVIHLFVTLPYMLIGYGLPISTSLANIGALVGVGLSSYGASGINKKTVTLLVSGWVATVLVTALATYTLYSLLFPWLGPIICTTP